MGIGGHRVGHEQHGEYGKHEDGGWRANVGAPSTFDEILDRYGGLYIERANIDGCPAYLVSIRDIPGRSELTLNKAAKSAARAIAERECAHGGDR